MNKTYQFSPQEQAFFTRKIADLNTVQSALQNTISLVIEQQGLQGTWWIKQDGTGLELVETASTTAVPVPASVPDAPDEDDPISTIN